MWTDRDNGCRSAIMTSRGAAVVLAFSLAAAASAAPAVDADVLRARANEYFGLAGSDLATLDVDRTPGVTQAVEVSIDGVVRSLRIAPHSVRAPNYRVRAQIADGSFVEVEPGPVRTVRGEVVGVDGSSVYGDVSESGLTAFVALGDGPRYWIEPLFGRIEGATPADHAVYSDSSVLPNGKSCATAVDQRVQMMGGDEPDPEGPTFGCDGLPCEVELACDADVQFFNIWNTVAGVEARINSVMNAVNAQYERDVAVRHLITTILVRTAEPDPYSQNECGAILNDFRAEWLANQTEFLVDEHQLFSGQSLDGCAGIAFTIGGICTNNAFCVVDHEPQFAFALTVSAHELGHLWNGSHCDCITPPFTMNPFLLNTTRFNPDLTIPDVVFHRETRTCLSTLAPPTSLPFFDEFSGPGIDEEMWFPGGATVSDLGNNEPSGTTSLRLSGLGMLTSGYIDATAFDSIGVEYWWEPTGNSGGSPEFGEDLAIQYKAVDGNWVNADTQAGSQDGNNTTFERACALLPADADLEALQIRLRILRGSGNLSSADNYFVDDFRIVDGADVVQIVEQPTFDCACADGTAEFSVVAAGEAPLSYQWRLNGLPIPGATSADLVVSPVGLGDFGDYSVEVTNGCGAKIVSESVVLLEATPLSIVGQPQDSIVGIGGTLALFTSASGGCPDFQWFFNGDPIAGENSAFLFIPNMQCGDQGCYTVEVSNDCGAVLSDVAEVTVESCGPLNCSLDSTPPQIVHGFAMDGETRPFSGYVDPRLESLNGVDADQGITEVQILFSEPVDNVGGGALSASAFTVTETGGATPPSVTNVDASAMPLVVLTLSRPLTLQEWTTIRAEVQDQAEMPNVIVNAGDLGPGINEDDRVDIGFLPADINQSSNVNPLDLLAFKQLVNGVQTPVIGTLEDFVDTDRNGSVNPLDLLRFKQLVNGVSPPSTTDWASKSMNAVQP